MVAMYDVFICYNWDDKEWADALHAALVDLGLQVFQDDKNIPFGDTLDPALARALLGSRVLVPLISPTFHESPSCRRELVMALTAAYRLEEGFTERVMPITWRVRPSALRPRRLKRPKLLTREGHKVAEQAAIIAAKIGRIKAHDSRRFGDAPAPEEPEWYPHGLPANKRFRGRGELLWELHEALEVKRKPGNRGHPVVSVRGEGGEGKTALCEQYARQFAEDHEGGVFVLRLGGSDRRGQLDPAAVLTRFRQQVREFAGRLGVDGTVGADELMTAVGTRLGKGKPYLWLLDDVPSAVDEPLLRRLYAPSANGRTLITTRGELKGVVSEEIVLEPLDVRSGVGLLTSEHELAQGRSAERTAALGIVAHLGRNALGLTIAAGLTRTAGFTGYVRLRKELRGSTPDSLEMAAHLTDVPLAYRREFSAVLLRSFRGLSDAGRDALAVSSVLADSPLPRDLVDEVLAAAVHRRAGAEGFAALADRGLATRLGDDRHRVHAMVARAARFFFPAEHRRKLHEAAVDVIGDSLEAARDRFEVTCSLSSRLPHVLALATTSEWPSGPSTWHVLNEAGRSLYELGDTAGSLFSLELLHRLCERSPEADDENRLVALVNLAVAHFGQGDYAKAAELQRESVARLTSLTGFEDERTVQAKENLANTLVRLGQVDEAAALLELVYRTRRDLAGLTSRRTLITLNNLVLAMGRTGARTLALRLAFGAWALWQRAAGPDVPETLEAVEAVGHILLRLGNATDAADTYDYVAARREVVLGPDHPDTVDAAENAAIARRRSYWAIYAERVRTQGPEHVDTLQTLLRLLNANLVDPNSAGDQVVTLADIVLEVQELAVDFQNQESVHGEDDPRALRADVVLAHALGVADLDGQGQVVVAIAEGARDGFAEVAARRPDDLEPFDLVIAETIHHWVLGLVGEQPRY